MSCSRESHAQGGQLVFFERQLPEARRGGRFIGKEIVDDADGDKRVLIDGIAMVEIAHDEAFDSYPLRQGGCEHARFFHLTERERGMRLGEQRLPLTPGKWLGSRDGQRGGVFVKTALCIPGKRDAAPADKREEIDE